MKKAIFWMITGLALLAVVVAVRADEHHWRRWGGHAVPLHAAWYLSHELKLTAVQKEQISTIWQSERQPIAVLVRELAVENAEMNTAAGGGDDSRIAAIANRQGATLAKLLAEKERIVVRVYATVLNQDQRKKADEIQQRFGQRLNLLADRLEQGGRHED